VIAGPTRQSIKLRVLMVPRLGTRSDERENGKLSMATFHFDLVSPEKILFSGEVSQVDVPGSEGDFGVLAAHAPLVTTLRPGILVIHSERDAQRIVVDGGFAEVGPAGLTVLANIAVPVDEFDVAELAGVIKDTEEDVADEKEGWKRDKLAQKLDRLKALQAALGH
jgi:F-type H+-transporting ATPase subunit epsilon